MTSVLAEILADGRTIVALLLAATGASIAAASIVLRVRHDRATHGPAVRTLAADLGLAARDRRLVVRLARFADTRHAGALLISRGCFDRAAARYTERFGPDGALPVVRRRLFDDAAV